MHPTHSAHAYSSLLARIEDKRDDLINLTQQLIRIPTLNPPGDCYSDCAHLLGKRLKKSGFQVQYIRAKDACGDSDGYPRINVVARLSQQNPCIHFNGHMDVVEVGNGWSFDPFAATLCNGKIYGRGACDMKGGIAASVIACEALIESGLLTRASVEISATVDEESGGFAGVGYLAKQGFFEPSRVQHIIVPEPLGVDRICLGHRGIWWGEIETLGKVAHGAMPFLGDNAIAHMVAFLYELETKLIPQLNARKTKLPVVPDAARSSTLNINSVHGGHCEQTFKLNESNEPSADLPTPVVAHSCRVVLDRRFIYEESLEAVKQEIIELLENLRKQRKGFDYLLRDIMSFLPSATSENAAVVTATQNAIKDVLTREAQLIASPGSYDQKHIIRHSTLRECIAYGPGILDLAHQADEYVAVADLVNSAKVMALAVLNLQNNTTVASI